MWPLSLSRIVLADGAANNLRRQHPTLTPTDIAGDLDSVTEETLSHYRSLGVAIHQDEDKYRNDFEKALSVAMGNPGSGPIIVIGGHDGRFDQTLANLNVLLAASTSEIPLIWLQPNTAVTALSPGSHVVTVDKSIEGPACGLLPVFERVREVTTTGLRWNLSYQPLQFGGLISSSNIVEEDTVTVNTSEAVLWTIEVRITE